MSLHSKRDHLAAAAAPLPRQAARSESARADRLCVAAVDEPLELVEVVEPDRTLSTPAGALIVHGSRSITSHSTAFFSSTLNTVSTLLTVFGALFRSRCFSRCTSSFVIASSRFAPSAGTRCDSEDHLLRRDPAWLLSVRPRVSVEESRRELFKCGHLLLGLRRTVLQQVPLPVLAPSLCG